MSIDSSSICFNRATAYQAAGKYKRAIYQYRQAYLSGHEEAGLCLARLVLDDPRYAPKKSLMVRLYRLLAEKENNASAQFQLGYHYSKGKGVGLDSLEAARWYELAANGGHSEAQYRLGKRYLVGRNQVALEPLKGQKLLREAAVQGHRRAKKKLNSFQTQSMVFRCLQLSALAYSP